eukprot:TRINITY_DN17203_c0_g1_i1.p2 TRINITY_DN17203_c0_g1~~TRINITY_DN17203_c0_g1_i1.p2  ORF type:complete len:120 (-),score=6.48 TRINITY_DN17203_c0_g1_i1:529-888(-)
MYNLDYSVAGVIVVVEVKRPIWSQYVPVIHVCAYALSSPESSLDVRGEVDLPRNSSICSASTPVATPSSRPFQLILLVCDSASKALRSNVKLSAVFTLKKVALLLCDPSQKMDFLDLAG